MNKFIKFINKVIQNYYFNQYSDNLVVHIRWIDKTGYSNHGWLVSTEYFLLSNYYVIYKNSRFIELSGKVEIEKLPESKCIREVMND